MKRGFTLIELLVVIAIISILASILFPVFARAREKGRQTACLSNVRQLVMAMQMYAQDADETLPGIGEVWTKSTIPYTRNKQILVCPTRKDLQLGYGQNPLSAGVSLSAFWDPAAKILLADADLPGSDPTVWWVNDLENTMGTSVSSPPANRHNDGANFGYVDGHTKWGRSESLANPVYWVPSQPTFDE